MTEIVDLNNTAELDEFVTAHEHVHFMQTSLWGKVKTDWGWRAIICRDSDGKIKGTMALLSHEVHMAKTRMLYAPCGPIFDWDDYDTFTELVEAAKEYAKENGAYVLRLDPCIDEKDEAFKEVAKKLGFSIDAALDFSLFQPRLGYLLDLEGVEVETLEKKYHRSTRTHLHRAQNGGVQIRYGTKEDLPRFCEMMDQTAEKNNFAPRKQPYFESFLDGMGENAKLYIAELDGKIIAGSISTTLGNRSWFMYGCSDSEYLRSCPNELLQWKMQADAIESGCRWFDFRGVEGLPVEDNPFYGLHRYKHGFGAEFTAYVGQLDFEVKPLTNKLLNLAFKFVK